MKTADYPLATKVLWCINESVGENSNVLIADSQYIANHINTSRISVYRAIDYLKKENIFPSLHSR
jgi:hypothetical protein